MQTPEPRWKQLQRGQALVEYWPTIPAAVAVMIGAAILVDFVNTSFLKTANGLDGYCKPAEVIETEANIFNHHIESSGSSYDPKTDRTTIAFRTFTALARIFVSYIPYYLYLCRDNVEFL